MEYLMHTVFCTQLMVIAIGRAVGIVPEITEILSLQTMLKEGAPEKEINEKISNLSIWGKHD